MEGGAEQVRKLFLVDQIEKSKKCVISRLRTCPDNACEGEAEERRACGSGKFLFFGGLLSQSQREREKLPTAEFNFSFKFYSRGFCR